MRNVRLLMLLCSIFVANATSAQSSKSPLLTLEVLESISAQVDIKAQRLCEYIEQIGSSRSPLTDGEKSDIIANELPRLFWRFDIRKMTTTGGINGQYKRVKSMKQYFNNLKWQSKTAANREVKYELYYDRITNNQNIQDLSRWERLPDHDNCEVYRTSITFAQNYYIISHNIQYGVDYKQASRVVKEEVDKKSIYIYLIRRKDDNRNFALLGDVYMAERLNN